MLYNYASYTISSSIPLAPLILLAPKTYHEVDFHFRVSQEPVVFDPDTEWQLQSESDKKKVFLSLGQYQAVNILHFPEIASFWVSHSDKTIKCYVENNTPNNTIVHLLLDQVLPRVLTLSGHRPLHSSAVNINDKLVLFLGESGQGKSTLALSFHQVGYPAVTDDVIFLEKGDATYAGFAPYNGLRLWQDSISHVLDDEVGTKVAHYNSKRRVETHSVQSQQLPIRFLVILEAPEENSQVELRRMTPLEAVMHLTASKFRLDKDSQSLIEEFEFFVDFANAIPFYDLTYPHNYDDLPQVHKHILALAKV
jgi:hypothetical protein